MRYRQVRIPPVHYLSDGSRNAYRIGSRSNHQIRRPPSREIHVVRWLGIQSELVYVARDSDDCAPARLRIQRTKIDALAERVALRPEAVRHRFIDHRILLLPVVFGEETPLAQGDRQCRKIAQTNRAKLRHRTGSCSNSRLPANPD